MSKITVRTIARLVLGIAAIVFIVISMATDKTNPYLAMGLACVSIANVLNWTDKKGYNCSGKDSALED